MRTCPIRAREKREREKAVSLSHTFLLPPFLKTFFKLENNAEKNIPSVGIEPLKIR
jgi:hypothetical protein